MAAPAQQQREEDKVLRGHIRGLLERTRHDKHNLVSVDNNKIAEIVQESNQYIDKVTRPRDQAVDAELFNLVTEGALEYVNRLKQGGRNYTAADFLRRLKARHVSDMDAQQAGQEDPEAFNWAGLGQMQAVAVLFKSVPVVHHMLGPMDAQPRQRRQVQRQARRRAVLGEAVRPEDVENLEDQEKQETDRNMEEMWHVLKDQGGRVPLLDLVINHASFAQTVENLFTLSFLVRDNKVALENNEEEGVIVVQRANVRQDPKDKGQEAERMQFLIPLDIETWELWKQVTDPDRPPMMKHRKEWRQAAAAAAAAAAQQQQQQQATPPQQQEQQQDEENEEQEEEPEQEQQEQQPRRRQKQQQQQPQTQRQQRRQSQPRSENQQQQQQQAQGSQQPQIKIKQEGQRRRQSQQQQQQQQQAEVVDLLNSSSSVVELLDSEDEAASPPPKKQARLQQAPGTQGTQMTQGTQLTQGTQGRMPKRGKRA